MSEQLISHEQAAGDMLAAAAYLAQRIKSSEGHADAMKSIVPRYVARGSVDLAAELTNTIDDPYTRDRLLIQVAEKCSELGDEDYGLQLADAIEDIGMQSQARERVAIRKAVAGDLEKAASIAQEIIHPDYVYAEIAAALAKTGRDVESAEALAKIELPVARASALQAIAAWNLEAGNADAAIAALDKAVGAASEIEHNEELVRTLGEIGNAFIDAGRKDRAIQTFQTSQEFAETLGGVHRDTFLSAIAIGFARASDVDLADAALDLVGDRTQIGSGLLGFARELWDAGDKDDAREALEEAYSMAKSQKENEVRDTRAANVLMGLIAAQYALFDKPERAIEIAQENRDENERINTLSRIAQTSTLAGDENSAELAIRAIGDESQRVFALFGIAQANAKRGDNTKAISVLDQAVDLAADLPQPMTRATVFDSAAAHYLEYGSREKAIEAVIKTLDAIALIRSDVGRSSALASLSEIFAPELLEIGRTEREAIAALIRQSEW